MYLLSLQPLFMLLLALAAACKDSASDQRIDMGDPDNPQSCLLIEDGHGPAGQVQISTETVVSGLEVPWGLAFLPNGDALVTERPGRVRLVRDIAESATLEPQPVATIETGSSSEGGLLGIALHPDFAANRFFYLYVTISQGGSTTNQIERWRLADSGTQAARDRIIYAGIEAARYHNGGRLRFGPDGMLYVGTGDAREPDNSQDPQNPSGKLLRLTPDGSIPADNPIAGSPAYLTGIRNTQGWDWPDPSNASLIWLTDHGPSWEMLRRGHDEVHVARAGDNLGWPEIWKCQQQEGMLTPVITWKTAAPPGGAAIYTGSAIPEWRGSLLIGTLGSRHLQRVVIEGGQVTKNEVYLQNELGRLREVIMGPDGALYLTTSNCDGRGDCGGEKDRIMRIGR
jgi:aldose sugar dehydrogenase